MEAETNPVFTQSSEVNQTEDLSPRPKPNSHNIIQDLVSNYVLYHFELYFTVFALGVLSFCGLVSNLINIVVFWKQGLSDSVTVSFFALSWSDLFSSFIGIAMSCGIGVNVFRPGLSVHPIHVSYFITAWWPGMFYSISCTIASVLSIERCICVVLPFKVKTIFRRSRTIWVIFLVFVAHIAILIPVLSTQSLRWRWIPSENRSRLLLWTFGDRARTEDVFQTVCGIAVPSVSHVIMTVCTVVMLSGLKSSSKFRKSLSVVVVTDNSNKDNSKKRDDNKESSNTNTDNRKKDNSSNQNINIDKDEKGDKNKDNIISKDDENKEDSNKETINKNRTNKDNISKDVKNKEDSKKATSNKNKTTKDNIISKNDKNNEDYNKETSNKNRTTNKAAASATKEARLVKTVVVIVVVFTICNLPHLVYTYTNLFVPEFAFAGAYRNTLLLSYYIRHFTVVINCTANFVIYYQMSSKFRETLVAVCCNNA